MRIRIDIKYDGTGFCGWQIQPKKSSVQGEITAAAGRLFGEGINLVGSGRTDAGVHAICQVAHFDIARDFDIKKVVSGLNFYLPPAIRVVEARVVPDNFSARFDAKSKMYRYVLYDSPVDNPLLSGKAHRVQRLDFCEMEKAATRFLGTFDFSPFMSSGSDIKNTVRTITGSVFKKESASFLSDGQVFVYEVSANGFLYNMVRKIVGVLLSVGEGKRSAESIAHILSNGEKVKEIAPPQGLYLCKVEY